jgi:hypothetical protein
MTETTKNPNKNSRARRLSAALRDNLKRRKAQAKARKGGQSAGWATAGGSAVAHESAGFAEDKNKG